MIRYFWPSIHIVVLPAMDTGNEQIGYSMHRTEHWGISKRKRCAQPSHRGHYRSSGLSSSPSCEVDHPSAKGIVCFTELPCRAADGSH